MKRRKSAKSKSKKPSTKKPARSKKVSRTKKSSTKKGKKSTKRLPASKRAKGKKTGLTFEVLQAILRSGKVRGRPLTSKQWGFFRGMYIKARPGKMSSKKAMSLI